MSYKLQIWDLSNTKQGCEQLDSMFGKDVHVRMKAEKNVQTYEGTPLHWAEMPTPFATAKKMQCSHKYFTFPCKSEHKATPCFSNEKKKTDKIEYVI
jgi:hypothetical protein